MPTQRVYVAENWRNGPLNEILAEATGLSVRAAWKFFEQDLLLDRECSKTRITRSSKRGAITAVTHQDKKGARRPCPECVFHRENRETIPQLHLRQARWRRKQREGQEGG